LTETDIRWRANLTDLSSTTVRTYANPFVGTLPIQKIDTALVIKIVEPLWSKKPETAARLRCRIEAVLD
jgi:hypothetical protein